MNKKKIIIFILIVFIILVFFLFKNSTSNSEIMPNRDFDGVIMLTDPVDICTEFTDAQEFDDSERYDAFFEQCLLEFN